jgi:hypothetical protein
MLVYNKQFIIQYAQYEHKINISVNLLVFKIIFDLSP